MKEIGEIRELAKTTLDPKERTIIIRLCDALDFSITVISLSSTMAKEHRGKIGRILKGKQNE